MGALVNTNNVSEPITSWEDLKNSDAKITLGDVLRGASSQMAVLSCAYAMGGDAENLDPAFDYFKELASEGRIDVGDGSVERLNRGEIDVLVTWDYLTLQYRDIVAANNPDLNMECHVMQDGAVQSGYCLVTVSYTHLLSILVLPKIQFLWWFPHPAHCLSEGQHYAVPQCALQWQVQVLFLSLIHI